MKKKFFMYVLIALFCIIILLYAITTIENYMVKSLDVIEEDLDEKDIVVFQEIIEESTCSGKYLLNNGDIYSYSYTCMGKPTIEERNTNMLKYTGQKLDKIKKKDKGYLNMFLGSLKDDAFKRTTKTDRPSKKIYYIDYKNDKLKIIISSGEEVMKNKSFSSGRVISMLKKYSIRVD